MLMPVQGVTHELAEGDINRWQLFSHLYNQMYVSGLQYEQPLEMHWDKILYQLGKNMMYSML